jgi:exodeoxyribonuclease-3
VIGDFNICHREIDIARPKENANSIWFLPIERAKFTEFFEQGFTDTFRYLNPEARDQYTWWSYRAGAKRNNVWRRIDYACVSNGILDKVIACNHFPEIWWSDHCPIMLEIDL